MATQEDAEATAQEFAGKLARLIRGNKELLQVKSVEKIKGEPSTLGVELKDASDTLLFVGVDPA